MAWRDAVDVDAAGVPLRAREERGDRGGRREERAGCRERPEEIPPDRGRTADDDPRRGAVSVANIARCSARSAPRVGAGAEDAAATAEATRRRR